MATREAARSVVWAYELADHGATAAVIAAACGRSRRWARGVVERAGGPAPKRVHSINRERAFGQNPVQRAHAHFALRARASADSISDPAERLVRVYRAYRLIAGSPMFSIDQVYELTERIWDEGGVSTRRCTKCGQDWFQATIGSLLCPACEAFDAHLCAECGAPVSSRIEEVLRTGRRPNRGRPRNRCDNCLPKRVRAADPAQRELRLGR